MLKKLFLFCFTVTNLAGGITLGSELFPEVDGWKMTEEKQVYNNGNLWQLINGAADIFLSYDFQDLHIAEYTSTDRIIRVELYRHSTPENSYGIYTSERMPDYPQVLMGSQGYKSQGILNYLAGNYYVKVMSAGSVEAGEEAIAMVADRVNKQLAQPVGMPKEINYFPAEGKLVLTDSYIAQNFLGYSFFHSAFIANYKTSSEFQVFIIRSTATEVGNMIEKYFKTVKDDKIEKKGELFMVQDPFNGIIFLQPKEGFLVGIMNTENAELALDYLHKTIALLP